MKSTTRIPGFNDVSKEVDVICDILNSLGNNFIPVTGKRNLGDAIAADMYLFNGTDMFNCKLGYLIDNPNKMIIGTTNLKGRDINPRLSITRLLDFAIFLRWGMRDDRVRDMFKYSVPDKVWGKLVAWNSTWNNPY